MIGRNISLPSPCLSDPVSSRYLFSGWSHQFIAIILAREPMIIKRTTESQPASKHAFMRFRLRVVGTGKQKPPQSGRGIGGEKCNHAWKEEKQRPKGDKTGKGKKGKREKETMDLCR